MVAVAVKEPERDRLKSAAAADRSSGAAGLPLGDILKLDACGFLMSFFMSSFFFHFPLLARRYLPLGSYYVLLGPMVLMAAGGMFCASGAADRGRGQGAGGGG